MEAKQLAGLEARRAASGRFGHATHSMPGSDVLTETDTAAEVVDLRERAWQADATEQDLAELACHPSWQVRSAVADRPDPVCAERAARDRDPVVRARVLVFGVGLSDQARARLLADEQTMRAVDVLGFRSLVSSHGPDVTGQPTRGIA